MFKGTVTQSCCWPSLPTYHGVQLYGKANILQSYWCRTLRCEASRNRDTIVKVTWMTINCQCIWCGQLDVSACWFNQLKHIADLLFAQAYWCWNRQALLGCCCIVHTYLAVWKLWNKVFDRWGLLQGRRQVVRSRAAKWHPSLYADNTSWSVKQCREALQRHCRH